MARQKFYAVVKGREPGVYAEWFGDDGAEAQVKGLTQAVFKSFPTLQEAEAWYTERTGSAPRQYFSEAIRAKANTPIELAIDPAVALGDGRVVIFTDGACEGNPGAGGYAAILRYGERSREISGGYQRTTNNRMELLAAIMALKILKQRQRVVLYSDSAYLVGAMQKGWIQRWRDLGWQRRNEQGQLLPLKNADLWQQLLPLCEVHAIEWVQVPGHAGIPENERCDRLAVAAAHQANLPPDPGFAADER
jgi:ribonuclease HI